MENVGPIVSEATQTKAVSAAQVVQEVMSAAGTLPVTSKDVMLCFVS